MPTDNDWIYLRYCSIGDQLQRYLLLSITPETWENKVKKCQVFHQVNSNSPVLSFLAHQDSLKLQARHYKTLSNMYKKPNSKPNQSSVAQILDLEFKARRAFIDSDATREEDRAAKIFEAYPCFKDTQNVSLISLTGTPLCLFLCMLYLLNMHL